MFESLFADFYWSSVLTSLSKMPKEAVIAATAGIVVVTVHKQHCDAKVRTSEAEARKAEADLEALKIKTFAVEQS